MEWLYWHRLKLLDNNSRTTTADRLHQSQTQDGKKQPYRMLAKLSNTPNKALVAMRSHVCHCFSFHLYISACYRNKYHISMTGRAESLGQKVIGYIALFLAGSRV